MRILLSSESRKKLFAFLMEENKVSTLSDLSKKLKVPFPTLQNWLYNKRYIPGSFIPQTIFSKLEVTDKKEDNWGRVKGGKITYQTIIEKYGKAEMKKRQFSGGKATRKRVLHNEKKFILNLGDNKFLEFYGILLGDGWLSHLKCKNKNIWFAGISGNRKLDREFFNYIMGNIKVLFGRDAYLKERPNYNSIELQLFHKAFIKSMNNELNFPIGEKLNLKIHNKIYGAGFDRVRHVIRGVLDTDGCVYIDKTPAGKPYPCISIKMKAPILIKQIAEMLLKQGFKVSYIHNEKFQQIRLKGSKQLDKWMREIGSNNPRNLNKIKAPVA